MDKETLKTNYKDACDAYLKEFCKKHDFNIEDACWIAGRYGEIVVVSDYPVDMQTIIDDINLDAPEDEFFKWNDYSLEMSILGAMSIPNFRNWVAGCPRKSQEEIEKLKKLQRKIKELKEELKNSINVENF